MKKQVYLQTYGCQMNERDSEEVLGMLTAQGYELTQQPERADVILLNTCSVREHAEERAFGRMSELSGLKRDKPELILGVIGCMAKLQKALIFKRLPAVDLVAGPAELYDLPYLLAEIQEKRQSIDHSPQSMDYRLSTMDSKVMAVRRAVRPLDRKPAGDYHRPGVTAFVTIMEGCDKACTYCIVPMTRGQEISRPAEEIVEEITRLVEAGYREVTLLGQNVNSYGKRFPDGSGYKGPLGRLRVLEEEPDALLDFPKLLRRIDQFLQQGDSPLREQSPAGTVPRIRFTTSHPFDAHERLFEAMRDCPSVCESLHLPVQSGSNRILRAMRRGYTREAYLQHIKRLRALIPDISLSTDIIIGFPGETEEDFQQTVQLMQEVEYDNAYIFKYSPRPGTTAAAREDDVLQPAKEARNQELLALQEAIAFKRLRRYEGRTVEVLLEGPGRHPGQLFGRTRGNHGVIVEGLPSLVGEMVDVVMTRAMAHTLFGRLVEPSTISPWSIVRSP